MLMARLIVSAPLRPETNADWKATQLHVEGGSWGVEEYHVPMDQGYLALGAEIRESSLRSCPPSRRDDK